MCVRVSRLERDESSLSAFREVPTFSGEAGFPFSHRRKQVPKLSSNELE